MTPATTTPAAPAAAPLHVLTRQARALLKRYNEKTAALSKNFDEALALAWMFGKKLAEIKPTVGHGNWSLWIAENLDMSDRHARRHMALFHDNPHAESVEDFTAESVRKFRFGFVPEKERPQIEGDVSFARPAHHLTLLNDWRQMLRSVEIGKSELDEEEARRDLLPLAQWLCELYGMKPPAPELVTAA